MGTPMKVPLLAALSTAVLMFAATAWAFSRLVLMIALTVIAPVLPVIERMMLFGSTAFATVPAI